MAEDADREIDCAAARSASGRRDQGPVEILCSEIGIEFNRNMERRDIFVAFVAQLVGQIAERMELVDRISAFAKVKASTDDARDILVKVCALLELIGDAAISYAAEIHDRIHEIMPDDGPCDHNIDMLSSCVSAIRFGLETPCRSRHAAEAASHVWKHVYGISRFDRQTSQWQKQWARGLFQDALISLLPPLPKSEPCEPATTAQPSSISNPIQGEKTL
jgi:hypothetical protein